MQHEVKIPSLGESIVSGIITQWNCKNGDFVNEGDIIYELETDKITSEGTAEVSGVIEILAEVDSEVEIGQVVAKIEASADAPQSKDASESASTTEEKPSAPEPAAESEPAAEPEALAEPEMPVAEKPKADVSHEKQSPAVERLAAQTGIDPATVDGSGKDGRVTKGDMLEAQKSVAEKAADKETKVSAAAEPTPATEPVKAPVEETPEASPAPEPTPSPAPEPTPKSAPTASQPSATDSAERVTRKRMTPIRKKIAERLVSVKNEAAILTTFNEVDMSAVMKLRKEMQEDFIAQHGVKLGFMSFFVKAAVGALKAVPGINAQIDGNEIITNHFYDIGVAVGTERGLVVPVVRDCDRLSFAEIEQKLINYAQLAKEGKITIEDMQGGVFTISNGGVYGSLLSTPIINPPQCGILGMHTIQERPVAVNGKVEIRPMMYLALSYDHRIVDGKEAVTFLIQIKKAIENPSRLLFGL